MALAKPFTVAATADFLIPPTPGIADIAEALFPEELFVTALLPNSDRTAELEPPTAEVAARLRFDVFALTPLATFEPLDRLELVFAVVPVDRTAEATLPEETFEPLDIAEVFFAVEPEAAFDPLDIADAVFFTPEATDAPALSFDPPELLFVAPEVFLDAAWAVTRSRVAKI